MPDDAEVRGLLALMLLHDARRAARVDGAAATSRSTSRTARSGTKSGSARGSRALERAVRLRRPGNYQLQAAITPPLQAPDAEATDWAQIAELYGALAKLTPVAGGRAQPCGRRRLRRRARTRASS